jgi:hypothetical protein
VSTLDALTFLQQSDWSWRLPSLLQSVCSLIILAGVFFMPESPRWLCNKDRHSEALAVFAKWHGEGNAHDEFVQLEFAEVKAAIEFDKQIGQTGWADFFKTKGNRKRITILTAIGFFSQWSGNGLVSYYLKLIFENVGMTNPQTQLGINGGLKTLGLVENLGFAFLIDKLGRRPIYLISTIGTFVCFNIFTIISARYAVTPKRSLGHGFIAIIFFYGVFYDIKSGLMANYTTEILPYGLRAKGFTWMSACVTAALFFNQFVNGIALDALAWKYYIFYCVFLAFEIVVVYFYIVETRYVYPLRKVFVKGLANIDDVGIRPWRKLQSSSTAMMRLMLGRRRWRI